MEKEVLAVVFGGTRFHYYNYGVNNVTADNNHKPLKTILKKALCQAPLRLQKMIMTIQKYRLKLMLPTALAKNLSSQAHYPEHSCKMTII